MIKVSKQIKDALVAHRKWKEQLQKAIEAGSSEFKPVVVRQDNQCAFGKWLYDEADADLQQTALFQQTKQLHATFHQETGRILEIALQGRREEATRALDLGQDFARLSMEINSALIAWYQASVLGETAQEKTGSSEKMKAAFDARAKALTQVTQTQTGETMSLIVFKLAGETYAVASDYVREIQALGDVTRVPCTPDFVVGMINVRGAIHSVIDIRGFFGVSKQEITGATKVLLANAGGLEVGILADDVAEAKSLLVSEINPPLLGQGLAKEEYVHGVTKDMMTVLNLDALLRDERIIVHEEVS